MSLLYRVFPHLPSAKPEEPGHAMYTGAAHQGGGRWDNPDQYTVMYLADHAEAAVGESFAHLATWTPAMLNFPQIPGASRALGTYRLDDGARPLCDLDDANELVHRALRPTHVVIRNRARTQRVAGAAEDRYAGIRWWSFHRPSWPVAAVWALDDLEIVRVAPLVGHPAVDEAAATLVRERHGI